MADTALIAVEAAEPRFRVLKHQPSGIGFDADGKAEWPADQFTFRLRDEGAIRTTATTVVVPEGVIPGETRGWPVDALTSLPLDLTPEERERIAAAPIGADDGAPAEARVATPAPSRKSAAAKAKE